MYELKIISEEPSKIQRAMASGRLCLAIDEMFEELRKKYKYSENESEVTQAEYWTEKFAGILSEQGIDLDRMWE